MTDLSERGHKTPKRPASASRSVSRPRIPVMKKFEENEALEVVCRLCPLSQNLDLPCAVALDEQHVKLIPPSSAPASVYKVAHVFDGSAGQDVIFNRTAIDLIRNLVCGKNSLLFAYGITGSGKTYTMTGNAKKNNAGILPRTLDVVFNSIPSLANKRIFKPDGRNHFSIVPELEAAFMRRLPDPMSREHFQAAERNVERQKVSGVPQDMICAVFVSYLEVYNDICYDLLDEPAMGPDGIRVLKAKDIRQGTRNTVFVDRLVEVEVSSSSEALEQFYRGQLKRRFADTLLNKGSSRSHSIFNIRLVMAPCSKGVPYPQSDVRKLRVSQLSLVDLAGSERTKRTYNEGVRLTETCKINRSLFALRQCFEKLRENQNGRTPPVAVPYRDSKLTRLFRNFLEGAGKIRMIICLNPRVEDYAENVGVMGFAELAQDVETTAREGVASSTDCLPEIASDNGDCLKLCDAVDSAVAGNCGDGLLNASLESCYSLESLNSLCTRYFEKARKRRENVERKELNFEEQLKRFAYEQEQLVRKNLELQEERNRTVAKLEAEIFELKRKNLDLLRYIQEHEKMEKASGQRMKQKNMRSKGCVSELCKKVQRLYRPSEEAGEALSSLSSWNGSSSRENHGRRFQTPRGRDRLPRRRSNSVSILGLRNWQLFPSEQLQVVNRISKSASRASKEKRDKPSVDTVLTHEELLLNGSDEDLSFRNEAKQ